MTYYVNQCISNVSSTRYDLGVVASPFLLFLVIRLGARMQVGIVAALNKIENLRVLTSLVVVRS
jgi:hypothetical protein